MENSFSLWAPWRIIDDEAGVRLHDDQRGIDFKPGDRLDDNGPFARDVVARMATGEFQHWLQDDLVRRFVIREE